MMTPQDLDTLRSMVHLLGDSRSFAESLLQQSTLPRGLSFKQQAWVVKLIERARRVASANAPAPEAGPQMNAEGVATLRGWLDRMSAAGTLRPRLRYANGNRNFVFATPGADSRYAGQPVVFVRVDREYVGRIQRGDNGERFIAARAADGPIITGLAQILADPLHEAIATGHQTGNCCFCGRDLTDSRSVSRGYGPICAARLGLPWGNDGEVADSESILPLPAAEVAVPGDEDGPDDEDRRFM